MEEHFPQSTSRPCHLQVAEPFVAFTRTPTFLIKQLLEKLTGFADLVSGSLIFLGHSGRQESQSEARFVARQLLEATRGFVVEVLAPSQATTWWTVGSILRAMLSKSSVDIEDLASHVQTFDTSGGSKSLL